MEKMFSQHLRMGMIMFEISINQVKCVKILFLKERKVVR